MSAVSMFANTKFATNQAMDMNEFLVVQFKGREWGLEDPSSSSEDESEEEYQPEQEQPKKRFFLCAVECDCHLAIENRYVPCRRHKVDQVRALCKYYVSEGRCKLGDECKLKHPEWWRDVDKQKIAQTWTTYNEYRNSSNTKKTGMDKEKKRIKNRNKRARKRSENASSPTGFPTRRNLFCEPSGQDVLDDKPKLRLTPTQIAELYGSVKFADVNKRKSQKLGDQRNKSPGKKRRNYRGKAKKLSESS